MNIESILVVDDNPDNLELTRVLLECEGFDVRVADDAPAALRQLGACKPKLILMDIQLPGMDGLTLTRQLRQDPLLRDVVIVALTAYAMKDDHEDAVAAGCDGYITKPINTRTFPAAVRDYLEGRGRGNRLDPWT